MDTSLISKIHKAKQYAEDRSRFSFQSFSVSFAGTNQGHTVTFDAGTWNCDCDFFGSRGYCSHTMALERLLDGMLVEAVPVDAEEAPPAAQA